MLLKAGAKPDAADCHNRTPLHYASYKVPYTVIYFIYGNYYIFSK